MTTARTKTRSSGHAAGIVDLLRKAIEAAQKGWSDFWFRSASPEQMKLFRVAIGSVMFLSVAARTFDLEFFFSEKGLIRQAILSEILDMKFRYSLFQLFPSMTAVWICHIGLLLALALMIFGVFPRLMAFAALIFHVSFLHRDVAIAYGVDIISTYYLFYLCFADYRPVKRALDFRRIVGSMFYRICQIQVCLIYGFAGLDKVKGPSWWRGDAIWMIFANSQRATVDLAWLAHYPAVIAFMTYTTLFWETYFPVLVWFKPAGRWISLGMGVLIHTGIALTMGLVSFSSIMVSTYCIFLGEDTAAKIGQCVKKYCTVRKVFLQGTDK